MYWFVASQQRDRARDTIRDEPDPLVIRLAMSGRGGHAARIALAAACVVAYTAAGEFRAFVAGWLLLLAIGIVLRWEQPVAGLRLVAKPLLLAGVAWGAAVAFIGGLWVVIVSSSGYQG